MTILEAGGHGRPAGPAARPRPVAPARIAGIDGMRGLAASGVLVYHLWMYASDKSFGFAGLHHVLSMGGIGVGVLFSLSGVLLYRPFAGHLLGLAGPVDLRRYSRGRLLRLMPAYWFVLVVTGVVFGAALLPGYLTGSGDEVGRLVDDPVLLLSNAALVQSFHPSTFLTGIGPAWTLAVELSFYVVLPGIVAVTARVFRGAGRGARLAAACAPPVLLLVLGIVVKAALDVDPATGGWDRSWTAVVARSFLGHADLFAFGMALAVVWQLVGDRLDGRRWRPLVLAAAFTVMVLTALVSDADVNDPIASVGFSLASALLVAPVLLGGPSSSRALRLLDCRPLAALGLVSYSLYLCHEPVIHWLRDTGVLVTHGGTNFVRSWILVTLIAVPFAAATYLLVERPALRRKAAGSSRRPR